jgi:hypothetical protein
MKKRIVVLLMAAMMLAMSASPALAAAGDTDRPRPTIPRTQPGTYDNSHEQRPANAVEPVTGPFRG